MIQLSKRLEMICSFILPETTVFADIGSDHALLPCAICLKDKKKRAIVSDVREGPLESAKHTIKTHHLEDRMSVRLGSGLSVLKPFEAQEVIISGMGGTLIAQILEDDHEVLESIDRIIIQANIDCIDVRKKLNKYLFHITEEAIVEDRGHLYEVIVAERKTEQQSLSEKEFFFGPYLLDKQPPLFIKKYERTKQSIEGILKNLEKSSDTEQKAKFKKQLQWMEEIIKNADK